jgi:hypothetical protein
MDRVRKRIASWKIVPWVTISIAVFVTLIATVKSVTPAAIADIAAEYTSYQKVTDKDVFVNPELAMLCVGASREQVENARTRHGPHANTAILVYMNKPAAQAFSGRTNLYPVGSVIVKQKRIHGYWDRRSGKKIPSAENGVGGMVKRAAGYDPAHGDWEYFYFEDKSRIQAGRIQSCVQCHEGAKDKDYVFGTWRSTPAVESR